MLFSRIVFDSYFDTDRMIVFHNLLLKDFPEAQLIWRKNLKVVDDPDEANNGVIENFGEKIFVHNSQNDRGIVIFANTNGKEEAVLKALNEAEFPIDETNSSTAYGCAALFLGIVVLLCIFRPELSIIFIIAAALIFGGVAMLSTTSKKILQSDYFLRNIGSVILISLSIPMSLSSLLMLPLLKYINSKTLYLLLQNQE